MEIRIVHLYPDLLNLYGDKGNICALSKRCSWRDIDVFVHEVTGDSLPDLDCCDILFVGGGGDHEQELVLEKLLPVKDKIKEYLELNGTVLACCGGFSLLGELGVLNIVTKRARERASGNVVIECEINGEKVLVSGFENHNYITDIGDLKPLGNVLEGFGNNGMGFEGAVYKNVIATNLHGPLLPKNPALCDLIIKKTLDKKYNTDVKLELLCDNFENIANKNIIRTVLGENK